MLFLCFPLLFLCFALCFQCVSHFPLSVLCFLCVSYVLLMFYLCFPYAWPQCVSYAIPMFCVDRRTSIKDHPVYGTGHSLAFPVFRCFSYAFRMFYYMSLVCPLFAYANTFSDIWFRVSLKIKGYRCSNIHIHFHMLGFRGPSTNYKCIIFQTNTIHESNKMTTTSFNKRCKGPL